ncbi:TlpA disulfide reductase family protein [Mesonia sp.]|uniref:TlpA disulfide reductase family protein n=1 Tax=Mesonia sp. TaxID=1960830 RepID=UPI0017744DE4|nr:TlpA disulfide reductase family protein [Mesonia sp.]HIB36105.1 TlpA family protein disulfide reductase [Mesonia sp.]HIO26291.1 TlpA family protein disulfide reductase [Flavobacteriaceae bacterium]
MKYNSLILGLTVTFLLFSCKENETKTSEPNTKNIGNLTISKAKPKAGDSLTFTYTEPHDHAEIFYQANKNLYAQDLEFLRKENNYQANFVVPDSAGVFALSFEKGNKIENNDNLGYVANIYSNDNSLKPGSKASKAYMYYRYGSLLDIQPKNDSLLAWMKADITANPEIEENWDEEYFQILNSVDPNQAKAYAQSRIDFYQNKKETTEEESLKVVNFYKALKEDKKAEGLKQQALLDYPNGKIAKTAVLDSFSNTTSLQEKNTVLLDFNKKFKREQIKKENDYMLSKIAQEHLKLNDFRSFLKYSMEINDKSALANLYNSTAWDLAEENKNLEEAAQISEKSLEIISKEKETLSKKPTYLSASKYRERLDYDYQMYADTYAFILSKQGKIKEAVRYQKTAVGKGEQADINERYIKLLIDAEMYKAAEDASAKFIAQNQATQNIKDSYKEMFMKNNTNVSESLYRSKLNELENKARFKLLEEIKGEKLNEKAPSFVLQNANGKPVQVEDFAGKTIVLDFWATWCGPCKASFPGMKKAVEKYKDNKDIVFLFINTFENGEITDRVASSKEFMEKNNYPFKVFFDQKKENSREFTTAENYGISGIPTKVIIGPDGNINFKKVGYSGNNEKMLQEIEIMLELSRE